MVAAIQLTDANANAALAITGVNAYTNAAVPTTIFATAAAGISLESNATRHIR